MFRPTSRTVRLIRGCSYLFLGMFLVFSGLVLKILNKSCSYAKSEQVELDLCEQYHRNEISGSMCGTMCDEHKLSLEFCGNNRARVGRKDVLIMGCDDCGENGGYNRLVMKIQVTDSVWDNATKAVLAKASSVDSMINSTKQFIKSQIKTWFDQNSEFTGDDYLQSLLGREYQEYLKLKLDKHSAFVTLKTVLALTLQPEFLTLILFRQASFMPKLYGYCGPAYYVEYTPPITALGYVMTYNTKSSDLLNMRLQAYSWTDRAKLGLQFLDIIRSSETLGSDKQLELCDFKPHNFGINSKNNITFLDSDDCVFDMRYQGRTCHDDSHCTHNYCEVYCDKSKNKCSNRRLNNNLQIACQYTFLGDHELLGLLRSPPEDIKDELNYLLYRCSYPKRYDKTAVISSKIDHTILDQIERILIKSIS